MVEYMREQRTADTPYDVVVEGETPGDQPAAAREILKPWVAAGATWWTETRWNVNRDAAGLRLVRQRIEQGPPG
jgi:hypothetical protein